jgi:hypothetical protein
MAHIHTNTYTSSDWTFHPFPRLPAELRAIIWTHALSNEPDIVPPRHFIHIHQENNNFHIRLVRNHPILFFVNREARYEAARIDGGAWYSLGVGNVELYVNFDKDTAYIYSCCSGSQDARVDRRFMQPECHPVTRSCRSWAHGICYYSWPRHGPDPACRSLVEQERDHETTLIDMSPKRP